MKGILESEGRLGFFMDDSSSRRYISRREKEQKFKHKKSIMLPNSTENKI
jgi:hypothetical protein